MKKLHVHKGGISIVVLLFGVTISAAIGSLVLIAATLFTAATRTESFERALTIAQSGAEYYRWHLAHDPNDFKDGTGSSGPYIHQISDPYGQTEGTFSLTITPPESGSSIVTITSTGWLNAHPDIKRTVKVRLGIPSVAKYAFLQNANVWYGSKTTVNGKVFSNGGIRMDGDNTSTVQSAKQTYSCGTETGCDPTETKPGVWGKGGPQSLWQFPVPSVDFRGIGLDFAAMKTAAQQTGVYLGNSGSYGYHVVFNANGTYTISTVTNANSDKGYSVEKGCQTLSEEITRQQVIGTYSIAAKPIIFAEDNVWVDGIVNGRATVVAARFPLDINTMNVWITDSVVYASKDGSSGLGIVAQNNIYLGLHVPQRLEINAALLSKSGNVIRHNYKYKGCSHLPDAVRQELNIYGSLISNLKSYWTWGTGESGYGSDPVSGFSHVNIMYDPNLYYTPPPYFPNQGEYEFISWEEQ